MALMLLALILTTTLFVCVPKQKVLAEELELDDNMVIEQGYGIYKIQDQALYDALFGELLTIDQYAEKLTVGAFKECSIEEFNFSGKNISSLMGLNLIKLPNLKRLNLSNNKLQGYIGDFDFMPNLEKIDLSNNQITGFSSKFSTKFIDINLSNNQLKSVDISSLTESGTANISFNNFSSFDQIIFPQTNCQIFATHNRLVDDIPSTVACTLNMGFQGIKDGDDILKTTQFRFYELDGVENLKLYKKVRDNTYELIDTILPNNKVTDIGIAEYKLEFCETGTEKVYQDIHFVCRPNTPTVKAYSTDNTIVDEGNHIFNQIIVLKIEAEGEIYYKINNGEVVKGNEIKINKSGSYTVTYWQNLEGMDSVKASYLVISRYYAPINIVWIILVVVFFVIMFMFGIYYTNVLVYKKQSKGTNQSRRNFE